MKFETDLIKYVIDLAIARRCYFRSQDLNADWLPFHTIVEVFNHVCIRLRVAKEVVTRCYKALLKMSSSHERHLTWAYKVQNIAKYLPKSSQAHSASHTTSSWTRHLTQHDQSFRSPVSGSSALFGQRKASSPSHFGEQGINLGRLTERSGAGSFFWQAPSPTSDQKDSDHIALRRMMREMHEEENAGDNSRVLKDRRPNPAPPVPASNATAVSSMGTSNTKYYQHYVPTARWEAHGIPISPIAPSPGTATASASSAPHGQTGSLPATPTTYSTPPPPPTAYQTPTAATSSSAPQSSARTYTNGGPFADQELLAMHARVAAIEAEARRTRELLANIAYLRETSVGARLDEHRHPEETTPDGGERYGEIPLSPYLKSVLHLPRAIIATETDSTESTESAETPLQSTSRLSARSDGSARSPASAALSSHRFTFAARDIATSGAVARSSPTRTASATPGSRRSPLSTTHAEPRSPYTSPLAGTNASPSLPAPAAQSLSQSQSLSKADFSSSLRCSAAMKKYLELTSHRTSASPSTGSAPGSASATLSAVALCSPLSYKHPRSPVTPSPGSGARGQISPHSGGGDRRSPAPSPSQRYLNVCRTQHAQDADMTTIDSKIDDELGDSLNIEEKDGKVYVHFQSKFLLNG